MAQVHMHEGSPDGENIRLKLHKKIESLEYKVKDARHHAEEWEAVAVREGSKKLELQTNLAGEKRHRLYERIGWLLLSISLVLAHHL
jgi:hypothetical protein